jgi:hypothetical protein
VLYYGETAFWVNFDIDVPLFLPIYASARLFDLRLIARTQIATNKRIQVCGKSSPKLTVLIKQRLSRILV